MKDLRKIALLSAIALISSGAQADFKAMDDAEMGEMTGQAGISIDTASEISIGEVAYQDEGFIAIRGITRGGAGGGPLDNRTIDIDVAGDAADIAEIEARNGISGIQDGDLVIHVSATDGDEQNVDFGLSIDEVSLEKSTYSPGQKLAGDITTNTVLLANIDLVGRLGPVDIVVMESTSNVYYSSYFAIDAGYVELPFLNISVGNLRVNNSRSMGAPFTAQNGNFAHFEAVIGASAKGLFIDILDMSADMDVENIAIGGTSIGSVYITDLAITATMDVYGH